jgi:hypothetical protein
MTLHKPLPKSTVGTDDPHPEQPSRIIGVFQKLDGEFAERTIVSLASRSTTDTYFPRLTAAGLTARMQRVAVREAVREEIMLVHSEGHWDRVRATGCKFCPSIRLEDCTKTLNITHNSPIGRISRNLYRILRSFVSLRQPRFCVRC